MNDWFVITGIPANLAVVAGAIWAVVAFRRTQREAQAATAAAQARDDRDWDARLLTKASEVLTEFIIVSDKARLDDMLFRLDHIAWQLRVLPELRRSIEAWAMEEVGRGDDDERDYDGATDLREQLRDAFRTLYPEGSNPKVPSDITDR